MHQLHDKGYRRLFKNKGIFRQLLETKGFDLPLIAEVTGLSDDAIIKLKQEFDVQRN